MICTSAQCVTGANSVTAMDEYFKAMDPASQATFKARHDAIMAQFDAAYSWYSPYIPFNPACCDVQTIGLAADRLLCEMAGGSDCVSPSAGSGEMSLQGMIVLGAVAFLAIQYVVNRR